jgi:hypothetical protein
VPARLPAAMPSRSARPSPRASALTATRRSVQLREQVEALQAEFDEGALHVAQRSAFAAFSLGPVRALPAAELAAGRFGWSRDIRRAIPAERTARETPERVGGLYLIVHPGGSSRAASEDGSAPGAGAGAIAFAAECRTTPRSRLVLRSEDRRATPALKRFAEALRGELEDETGD